LCARADNSAHRIFFRKCCAYNNFPKITFISKQKGFRAPTKILNRVVTPLVLYTSLGTNIRSGMFTRRDVRVYYSLFLLVFKFTTRIRN